MKGIYCLLIYFNSSKNIRIGAKGLMQFAKGYYLYVGSAQNNLEKRIKRHNSAEKNLRWHIDYILQYARLIKVYYKEADKSEECKTAQLLAGKEEPVKGFGASDCSCTSHLFRIQKFQPLKHGFNEWTK